jgi:hypothetical protein
MMSDQKKNFRSCPYCGAVEHGAGGALLRITSTSSGYFAVLCRCGALGPMRDSEQKAIAAWNTRNDSERHPIKYPFNLSETNDPADLKGTLKSLDFPVILQILSSANKTGVLHIYQGQEVRSKNDILQRRKNCCSKWQRGTEARANWLWQRDYFTRAVAKCFSGGKEN